MFNASAPVRRFVSEALVIGALGPMSAARSRAAKSWFERNGLGPQHIVDRTHVLIASNRSLEAFVGPSEGWHWNAFDRDVRVGSLDDAQVRAMSAGCVVDPIDGSVRLFNDSIGVQPLHVAVRDRCIWFSNWLPSLTSFVGEVLGADLIRPGPDVAGWVSILLTGFAPPGRSTLAGVETLHARGSIVVDGSGSVRRQRAPRPALVPGATDRAGLLQALRAAVGDGRGRLAMTLSGGWDSRLLAALSHGRGRRAWTTSTDDGIELDMELAPAVARHLGIRHRLVGPPEHHWRESSLELAERTSFATWYHVWLIPLARRIRALKRTTVLDGLGGDVLLKGLLQDPTVDGSARDRGNRRALWSRLGGHAAANEDVWSREARTLFEDVGFPAFDEVARFHVDDPAWQAWTVLTTRTARAIALSPLRLFGPEVPVRLPFLDPDVLAVALSEDLYPRRGADGYLSTLALIDPGLAALPSTNDPGAITERSRPRQQSSVNTLTGLCEDISVVDDAVRMLAPSLRKVVTDGDPDELVATARWNAPLRTLQVVGTLARWHVDHPSAQRGLLEG